MFCLFSKCHWETRPPKKTKQVVDGCDQGMPEGGQQGAQEARDDVLGGGEKVRRRGKTSPGDDSGVYRILLVIITLLGTYDSVITC